MNKKIITSTLGALALAVTFTAATPQPAEARVICRDTWHGQRCVRVSNWHPPRYHYVRYNHPYRYWHHRDHGWHNGWHR